MSFREGGGEGGQGGGGGGDCVDVNLPGLKLNLEEEVKERKRIPGRTRKERETLDKNSAGFELTPAHPVWPILKPRDAMWRRQLDRLNQIREGKCGSSRKRHLTFSKGSSGKI